MLNLNLEHGLVHSVVSIDSYISGGSISEITDSLPIQMIKLHSIVPNVQTRYLDRNNLATY